MQFKYLPNILSFSRIIATPFFIFLMSKSAIYYKIFSLCIFSICSFSDFLDGYLARKYNNISTLGKYLDPLADKVIIISGFFTLYLYYPNVIKFWMIVLIFSRDVFVMFLRNYFIQNRKKIETSYYAKVKTIFQIIVIHILLFFHIYSPSYLMEYNYFYILMVLTVIVTFLSAIPYFRLLYIYEKD
tara:strand:- start:457 stop:1014 length:558 start_codon:yes stop_codon:yes gene_type:complete